MKKIITFIIILSTLPKAAILAQESMLPDKTYCVQFAADQNTKYGFWDLPGTKRPFQKGASLQINIIENPIDLERRYRFKYFGNGWFKICPLTGGVLEAAKEPSNEITTQKENENSKEQLFYLKYTKNETWIFFTYTGKQLTINSPHSNNCQNVDCCSKKSDKDTEWLLISPETGKVFNLNRKQKNFFLQNKNQQQVFQD
ncbi:MAG: hypothetical protein PQJ46_17690 [Spirochaetales bacterium]|nr:hypothetical protein [Spirochaetales bacterium]